MTVVIAKDKRAYRMLPSFKRTLLSLAVATSTTTQIWAQDTAEVAEESELNVPEEVIVTGIRRSLIDSINTKRFSATVVEAISAEDIGKLPDSSIAESIARLPGLAAQRLDGRSSSVSVRGLGEDFSATTLNGREQVSISDNRGIEFDLYPSEIISGVTVYKSPDASLMSQGIAGIIDLKTVKPLNYDERTLQFNYLYEEAELGKLNPDGDDKGGRATLSYIDQFNEGSIGVALAIATMESPSQEERWNAWGYPTTDSGDFILGGAKPFVRSSTLERDTYMGVIEFTPNEALHVTVDALYIDFSDEKILRGVEIPGYWGGETVVNSSQNGLVTDGVFVDRKVQIRNDFERREAELTAYGLNLVYNFTDTVTLIFDASHSEVERDVWSLESYSGVGRANDNTVTDDIGFTMTNTNGVRFNPQLDYSDLSLVQLGGAQNWGNGSTVPADGQDGFINMPHIEDELDSLRLSVRKMFDDGLITAVEMGVNYSDRTKTKEDTGVFLTLPQYPGRLPIPDQYNVGTVSLDFIGMGNMVAYDSFRFWRDGNYNEITEDSTVISRAINDWSVTEEIITGYIKADFDSEIGGLQLTGNLGVQVVQTDQSSDGKAVAIDENGFVTIENVSDGDEYTEVLPSLNMSLHLTEEQMIRFAASRTMSRSRMDRMNASFSYGFDQAQNVEGGAPFTASGGNPQLQPNMANQYDLTYEYYFSDEGYFSAAAFYKDLRNWQIQQDVAFDMADLIPADAFPSEVLSTQGLANLWVSSKGGDITGYELTGSIPGAIFSDYLDGFGAILSATFIDSSLDSENGEQLRVPGLSEEIYSATVYYEKHGFQIRASMRKRDDFLGERFGTSFKRESALVVGSEIVDAQVAYDFGEAGFTSLDGLTISLQAQNITDEPYVTLNPDTGLVTDFQVYGRTFLVGFGYKF